jgi:DNA-binding NarL/FixJ family response regulator
MQTLRIIIADNQPETRSALKLVVDLEPGFIVAGEIDALNGLVAMAETVCADIILLDWQLRHRDEDTQKNAPVGYPGSKTEPPKTERLKKESPKTEQPKTEPLKAELLKIELLRQLRSVNPKIRIIALSGRPESQSDALAAGADVFVCKSESPDKLLNILRFIYAERAK